MKTGTFASAMYTFALVAAIGAAPVEAAQESGISAIEEIVVTARRREEGAQLVPIPVAMSGEEMRDRAANDLTDISRITPNMDYAKSASNRGAAQVFLRGIGQVNWSPVQDPKVGVYLDGVYLGRPQGAVFDIMDLERVEVVRGPQGTLFGRNTTAGLVHVITRKPQDEFEAEVQVGGGNDGQINVGGIVNLPISDTLATRFSFQHRESDGYVKNNGASTHWNDEDSQMFRGSALWTPTEALSAQLTFDYQRVREHPGLGTCEWAGPDAAPTFSTSSSPRKNSVCRRPPSSASTMRSRTPATTPRLTHPVKTTRTRPRPMPGA